MNNSIKKLRNEIDKADEKIILLLGKRMELSKKIGELKKKSGEKIVDNAREKEIFEKIRKNAIKNKIDEKTAQKIYGLIIKDSKKIQK